MTLIQRPSVFSHFSTPGSKDKANGGNGVQNDLNALLNGGQVENSNDAFEYASPEPPLESPEEKPQTPAPQSWLGTLRKFAFKAIKIATLALGIRFIYRRLKNYITGGATATPTNA
ncbi:MAG: hypothetical protein K2X66_12995 [Cyanobacteria bacterium]|nr:hypothetical protein [Cyanobacteriota bacterium]